MRLDGTASGVVPSTRPARSESELPRKPWLPYREPVACYTWCNRHGKPTIRLHKLTGDRSGCWSITIRLPWCITFRFENGDFSDVRIENYH